MKLSKILLLSILPILAFSYEVKFTKDFEKEVIPENVYMDIKLQYKYENESIVNRKLSMYTKEIDKANGVKSKQTYYQVRKNYIYKNNDRKEDGYIGEVSYQVWSNDQNNIDKLVDRLYTRKTDKELSILTSNISWDITDRKKKLIYDEIRDEAQAWGLEYQKTLERKMAGRCDFVSMVEEGLRDYDNNYPRRQTLMKANMESSNIPMPRRDEVKFNTTFVFHYDCVRK